MREERRRQLRRLGVSVPVGLALAAADSRACDIEDLATDLQQAHAAPSLLAAPSIYRKRHLGPSGYVGPAWGTGIRRLTMSA
jgi:hypothetical protein